ncbi:MAG TPA: HAD-IA family hydrolase [Acidimicrobiales bacterium]|nr:HAD-IA family hydrolase [Acidimicrobiales bacterium]
MRNDDGLEAVLLDAGGVLVLPDPARMRAALAPLGATPDDDACRLAHYAGMREVDRLGKADWPMICRVVARFAGVPEDRLADALAPIERIYLAEDWVPAPGAADALLALEAYGLRLAIVSNATGRMEQLLFEHRICGLDGEAMARVAAVVDSHVVGVEKPDPRIFSLALSALGVPPQRCVFLGDSVHFDVEGARNAGIRPVHLDPFTLCPLVDHEHVASLAAFAASVTGGA